jgi:hypothetical protein
MAKGGNSASIGTAKHPDAYPHASGKSGCGKAFKENLLHSTLTICLAFDQPMINGIIDGNNYFFSAFIKR